MQENQIVTAEEAREQVKRWLDFKRVPEHKRQIHDDSISVLEGAITDGILSVDDNHFLRHVLLFPLTAADGTEITVLKYRPLLSLAALKQRFGKTYVKVEAHTVIGNYAAALTDRLVSEIDQIDTEDKAITEAIVCFYL